MRVEEGVAVEFIGVVEIAWDISKDVRECLVGVKEGQGGRRGGEKGPTTRDGAGGGDALLARGRLCVDDGRLQSIQQERL